MLFSVVSGLPWPVIVINNDGDVIHVTRAIDGANKIVDIAPPERLETLFPAYFSALHGDFPWRVAQETELMRKLPGGAVVQERIVLRCTPAGSYLIVLDQTELRTLEHTHIQTARLAALGFMVAGVCHEMSNPLASIQSMVQILKSDKMMETSRRDKGLANIDANLKRLLDISGRLLNFGRVCEQPRAAFEVDAAIEEAFAIVRQDRRAGQVDFKFDPDPRALVYGSNSQLQEVFVNIFENALQAMDGVGTLGVTTRCKEGARVVVTICDTGPGITGEAMARLFEPFFTTKAPGCGTGLGLVISDEIIREHEGQIVAENNADTGACFRVELPLHQRPS